MAAIKNMERNLYNSINHMPLVTSSIPGNYASIFHQVRSGLIKPQSVCPWVRAETHTWYRPLPYHEPDRLLDLGSHVVHE